MEIRAGGFSNSPVTRACKDSITPEIRWPKKGISTSHQHVRHTSTSPLVIDRSSSLGYTADESVLGANPVLGILGKALRGWLNSLAHPVFAGSPPWDKVMAHGCSARSGGIYRRSKVAQHNREVSHDIKNHNTSL